jgi:NAD(P)-dependent dehydrogenase (short-subunit alcohol dehydrogenase family)
MNCDQFNLAGRVALITGSGRGIGLSIAQILADAGASVVLQDIELPVAEAAAREIADRGGRAIALGGDISDLTLPATLVAKSASAFGGLHILINNASIQSDTDWMDMDAAAISRQVNADLISPILFCQEACRIFKPQKFGRIINLGSIQQRRGNSRMLAYSMCKGALQTLTRALARELAKDQITVNLMAPGWMRTHRTRHDFTNEQVLIDKGKQAVPIGRIGEASDCAGAALLLCSAAGEYITGQSIFIDGGLSVK